MPKKQKNGKKAKKQSAAASAAVIRQPRPAKGSGGVRLSGCTSDYAKSMVAPWGPEAPCLPSGFPLPSLKRKFFSRGQAVMGTTAALGYVLANPYNFVASSATSIRYTSLAYTGSTVNATVGVGVIAAQSNSSYAGVAFGPGLAQFRVVTAGLRARYVGTEQNRGGLFVAAEHPEHESFDTFTLAQILSMQGIQTVRPPAEKWTTVLFSGPKSPSDLGYQDTTTEGPGNRPCMVIAFTGAPGMIVEFEFWVNYEIIGTTISGQTISHHDPVGASLVATAVDTAQQKSSHAGTPDFKAMVVKGIEHYGKEAISTVGSAVGGYVQNHGMELLGDAAKMGMMLL